MKAIALFVLIMGAWAFAGCMESNDPTQDFPDTGAILYSQADVLSICQSGYPPIGIAGGAGYGIIILCHDGSIRTESSR